MGFLGRGRNSLFSSLWNYELPLQKGTGFDGTFLTSELVLRNDGNPLVRVEFIAIEELDELYWDTATAFLSRISKFIDKYFQFHYSIPTK